MNFNINNRNEVVPAVATFLFYLRQEYTSETIYPNGTALIRSLESIAEDSPIPEEPSELKAYYKRHELFYKMIGSIGIILLLLVDDPDEARKEEVYIDAVKTLEYSLFLFDCVNI